MQLLGRHQGQVGIEVAASFGDLQHHPLAIDQALLQDHRFEPGQARFPQGRGNGGQEPIELAVVIGPQQLKQLVGDGERLRPGGARQGPQVGQGGAERIGQGAAAIGAAGQHAFG